MANASRVKKELDESEPRKGILQLLLKAFTQTDDEWPQVRDLTECFLAHESACRPW